MAETEAKRRNPRSWHEAVETVTALFMRGYQAARTRAFGHASPMVRMLAARNEEAVEAELLRRENGVLRRRLESIPARHRPQVRPPERFEIVQILRLRGWSAEEAAKRFVLHATTVRDWLRRFGDRREPEAFFGPAPFTRISGAVRWLVQEMRRLCPSPEFGTRSMAMAIVRAGIRISRSTVQRVLREKPAPKPGPHATTATAENPSPPEGEKGRDEGGRLALPKSPPAPSYGVLRPTARNRTWHLDFTTIRLVLLRIHVAALVDGFSRKLLALRVHVRTPTTRSMIGLIRRAMNAFGNPRCAITDRGGQFQNRFRRWLRRHGIEPVRGPARHPQFNGKVERFFKTFKIFQKLFLLFGGTARTQRQLDVFQIAYNERPMWVLGGRTPDEVWNEIPLPPTVAYRARDPVQPSFQAVRKKPPGPDLFPTFEIRRVA